MEYISKANPTFIEAHSRVSVKIKDTFYTFEYAERRDFPIEEDINFEKERELLWEECHSQVDNQVHDIINYNK